MKNLSFEKMEKIEGAWPSIDETCQAYGAGIAIGAGATPGSDEFYILATFAYGACWESYLQ